MIVAALGLLACGEHHTSTQRTTFARYPNGSIAFDPTASDPKALEIAGRVLAAAGGPARWKAAKQLSWVLTPRPNFLEFSGETWIAWDRWNGRIHFRFRGSGDDRVVIRPLYEFGGHMFIDKGQRLHEVDPRSQEASLAFPFAQERWELETAILFMPFLLTQPGSKLVYAGETFGDEGKPNDVLQVVLDPADRTRTATYTIVVDRETHMIIRIAIQKSAGQQRLVIKHWVDAAGLKLPSAVEVLGIWVSDSLGPRPLEQILTFSDLTISDPNEALFAPSHD